MKTNEFSKRLRTLRKQNNIRCTEMCKKLRVERSTIYRYENGSREPNISKLIMIADIFNVSLDYLLGRINKK